MNLSSITKPKRKAVFNPYLSSNRRTSTPATPAPTANHFVTAASPAATNVTASAASTPSSTSTAASGVSPFVHTTPPNRYSMPPPSFANGVAAPSRGVASTVAQRLELHEAVEPSTTTNTTMPPQNANDRMIYDEMGNLKEVGSIPWSEPKTWSLLAEHELDGNTPVPSDIESQIQVGSKLFTNQELLVAMTKLQVMAGVEDLEVLTTKKAQKKWFVDWYAKHTNLSIASAPSAESNNR